MAAQINEMSGAYSLIHQDLYKLQYLLKIDEEKIQ